jgi:probable HAF family extracellular repeat protein
VKRLLCALVALSLFNGGAGRAKADYVFTTLNGFEATGINDSAQIVGANDAGGFLYSGGRYTAINVPTTNRDTATYPYGINNAGQIVGQFGVGRVSFGFLLNGVNYTTFLAPGSTYTVAYGINAPGQIVGTYADSGNNYHGFLLSGGSYRSIDVPGSSSSSANGINDRGQIVGDYGPASCTHGFLLDGGSFTSINVPGSTYTIPTGINNADDIAGLYLDSNGRGHGFLLSGGSYTTIDVPGSTLTYVDGINDAGQLVGFYDDSLGNQHAFLATPTPEPSTLLLVALGTLGVIYWARR